MEPSKKKQFQLYPFLGTRDAMYGYGYGMALYSSVAKNGSSGNAFSAKLHSIKRWFISSSFESPTKAMGKLFEWGSLLRSLLLD